MTDSEIVKALERLKNTKDYLKEQYQEQANKCPYPELKPIAKQTYEDNKKAFDTAIKAIEELNRLQAENERLKAERDKEHDYCNHYMRQCVKAKAKAYKEFAELLCKYRVSNDPVVISAKCLLKELVGENDAP